MSLQNTSTAKGHRHEINGTKTLTEHKAQPAANPPAHVDTASPATKDCSIEDFGATGDYRLAWTEWWL